MNIPKPCPYCRGELRFLSFAGQYTFYRCVQCEADVRGDDLVESK